MKTFFTFLFIILSLTQQVAAQALHIDSTRFITGINCCTQINYAIPTADKGILFVGFDAGNPGGIIPYFPIDTVLENVLIGKIDSNRQISWIKVYGGSQDDGGGPACQTPDGGYAVLAGTGSNNGDVTGFKGEEDIWLLRLDAAGNLLWEKTYGSSADDGAVSIANTPDNGFIILGVTNGSDGDVPFHYGSTLLNDWVVIKTDSTGNVQWSKDIGGTADEGYGSVLAMDNGYYIVCTSGSIDHDCTDTAWHPSIAGTGTGNNYYVLRLDNTGNVLWDSSYGGRNSDNVNYAFFDARDSTIVMVGSSSSDDYMVTGSHGGDDMWVVKVNTNGALIWEKALGSMQQETGTGICAAHGGGYLAYCTTYPSPPDTTISDIGAQDCWLFVMDNSGNEITNKIYGGTEGDDSYSIVPYLNGYTATGLSGSKVFTEGTTYGNFDTSSLNPDGGGAFISFLEYWPLLVKNIKNIPANLNVYPNPSNERINIILPRSNAGNLIIINNVGKLIYREEVKMQTTYLDINIAELCAGIYLIIWQDEDGTVLTSKLIKN